jgi:predicted RNA binding protein YcfA (HicA-like mRNA interferase family)
MSRLPAISPSLMIKFLNEIGFGKSRQHGSHIFFRHPDGRTATTMFLTTTFRDIAMNFHLDGTIER